MFFSAGRSVVGAFRFLLIYLLINVCVGAYLWNHLLGGVAKDEGLSLESPSQKCDLQCCQNACDTSINCNSFAHTRNTCFLKDKCVVPSEQTKSSAYKTYYRAGIDCPRDASTYNLLPNSKGTENTGWNSTAV